MAAVMEKNAVDELAAQFAALSSLVPLRSIRNAQDYETAVAKLNQLLDAGAADEGHALAELADTLGTLIGEYDDAHFPAQKVAPQAMLRYFMEQHALSQSDLPEVGSQGVVSEILRGHRELNIRQIKALAARFDVSPAVFIE